MKRREEVYVSGRVGSEIRPWRSRWPVTLPVQTRPGLTSGATNISRGTGGIASFVIDVLELRTGQGLEVTSY